MRYKVLLTGNNKTIINEFFTYMDFSFECMNTSDRFDDIMNHIKYYMPDVFVYCLHGEKPDDLKRFANVGRRLLENKIPVIIIGDSDECTQFVKIIPQMRVTIIEKPITSKNIEIKICAMLDERKLLENKREIAVVEASAADESRAIDALLPRMDEMNLSPKAEPGEEKKKHILIVDDDSSVLKLLKGYLAERYNVATAINGKVALKFLETKSTDLVLLDYEMPGENGFAVLSKIRASEKGEKLPVVFLTGVTDRQKIKEVLEMKPQGYLLKPIDMERLSSTIKGILE